MERILTSNRQPSLKRLENVVSEALGSVLKRRKKLEFAYVRLDGSRFLIANEQDLKDAFASCKQGEIMVQAYYRDFQEDEDEDQTEDDDESDNHKETIKTALDESTLERIRNLEQLVSKQTQILIAAQNKIKLMEEEQKRDIMETKEDLKKVGDETLRDRNRLERFEKAIAAMLPKLQTMDIDSLVQRVQKLEEHVKETVPRLEAVAVGAVTATQDLDRRVKRQHSMGSTKLEFVGKERLLVVEEKVAKLHETIMGIKQESSNLSSEDEQVAKELGDRLKRIESNIRQIYKKKNNNNDTDETTALASSNNASLLVKQHEKEHHGQILNRLDKLEKSVIMLAKGFRPTSPSRTTSGVNAPMAAATTNSMLRPGSTSPMRTTTMPVGSFPIPPTASSNLDSSMSTTNPAMPHAMTPSSRTTRRGADINNAIHDTTTDASVKIDSSSSTTIKSNPAMLAMTPSSRTTRLGTDVNNTIHETTDAFVKAGSSSDTIHSNPAMHAVTPSSRTARQGIDVDETIHDTTDASAKTGSSSTTTKSNPAVSAMTPSSKTTRQGTDVSKLMHNTTDAAQRPEPTSSITMMMPNSFPKPVATATSFNTIQSNRASGQNLASRSQSEDFMGIPGRDPAVAAVNSGLDSSTGGARTSITPMRSFQNIERDGSMAKNRSATPQAMRAEPAKKTSTMQLDPSSRASRPQTEYMGIPGRDPAVALENFGRDTGTVPITPMKTFKNSASVNTTATSGAEPRTTRAETINPPPRVMQYNQDRLAGYGNSPAPPQVVTGGGNVCGKDNYDSSLRHLVDFQGKGSGPGGKEGGKE